MMIQKIKKLLELYKRERYFENLQDVSNPKTGISPKERKYLMETSAYRQETIKIFDLNFSFSHGPSLLHSLEEIFGDDIYLFDSENDTPYIIDCGANIGVSVLYFQRKYPKAKILAFEPDEEIFKILEKNITAFGHPSTQIRKEAVWTKDEDLQFYSEGGLAGSCVTDFAKKNQITTVKAIDLKKYLQEPVDFLKIDIEGAENTLIFDIADSLKNVKNLFLEYHGILNEEQNLGEILNLLKSKGFEYYIRVAGETIVHPFCNEKPESFNQQLNIFCYRKK
ncbi:FkbM family methyltransferase [Chryseobacterium camelliae]|uniref:FkbM family methyltransferase n=1 Tax=Chryseobacterium camelliae TaxID=1265445 RepID=A0ABY7QJL8_9FLAO|nr:FkbM family methyltransferase [Chryseobacterium camelliae]WBV59574.1 FkbM family methyltransferase [Chryseobacterium camelliae]